MILSIINEEAALTNKPSILLPREECACGFNIICRAKKVLEEIGMASKWKEMRDRCLGKSFKETLVIASEYVNIID
jgi:hypothetical protein